MHELRSRPSYGFSVGSPRPTLTSDFLPGIANHHSWISRQKFESICTYQQLGRRRWAVPHLARGQRQRRKLLRLGWMEPSRLTRTLCDVVLVLVAKLWGEGDWILESLRWKGIRYFWTSQSCRVEWEYRWTTYILTEKYYYTALRSATGYCAKPSLDYHPIMRLSKLIVGVD
jgi:hypothetical protein